MNEKEKRIKQFKELMDAHLAMYKITDSLKYEELELEGKRITMIYDTLLKDGINCTLEYNEYLMAKSNLLIKFSEDTMKKGYP